MRDQAAPRTRRAPATASRNDSDETLSWFLTANAGCLAASTQLTFAILREMPSFWRNSGGYPVWLRHLVLGGYYPLTLLTFGMGGVLTKRLLESPAASIRVRGIQVAMLLSLTALMGSAWIVSLEDNVVEFIESL